MTTALKPVSTVFRVQTTCPHCGGNLDEPQTDGVTLVTLRGERQRIVDTQVIGSREEDGKWLLEVPVICVESGVVPRRKETENK